LSFGFNKLLQQLRWPEISLRTISWLAWVVAMLLMVKFQLFSDLRLSDSAWLLALPQAITELLYTFKPELLILVSSAVLWWLGRRVSYLKINFTIAVSEFQFGLVILAITFFVTSQLEASLAYSIPVSLTFFLFNLFGMAIAHTQEGTSWLSGVYQKHWSGLLLVSISIILIVGLIIGSVVTTDLLQLILVALKWIWGLIVKVIAFLASLLPEPEMAEPPSIMPMPEIQPSEESKFSWALPESVRRGLRLGYGVVVAVVCVLALWRISSQIFRWLRRRLSSMAGAEVEPLPGAFKADLLSLLKRILLKLRRLRLPFRLRKTDRLIPVEIASVREIYRQFLRWAAAGGYPRQRSETPYEYLVSLADSIPEARSDLNFITQQYVNTRYGSLMPTGNELHQLRQSWHNIKRNRLRTPDSKHN